MITGNNKEASLVVAHNSQGKVLAVTRGFELSERDDWGLPGGMIQFGEQPLEAAIRECKEETGLTPRNLTLSYCDWGPGNLVFIHTYLAVVDEDPDLLLASFEGIPDWRPWSDVIRGSCKIFNTKLYNHLKKHGQIL